MIILFEGPDGSGKSTVIQKLVKDLSSMNKRVLYVNTEDVAPTKPSAKNRATKKEIRTKFKALAKDSKIWLIDRSPISDCVYRVFDNGQPVMQFNEFLDFGLDIYPNCFIVYCKTDKAEEYMLARGETNQTSILHHRELTKVYDLVFRVWQRMLPEAYYQYDFTKKKSYKDMLNAIIKFMFTNGGK